ncbi:MAG: ATP-dependent sacrificial sulfur transferase LarE [Candidatus Eisenbacteria bacterium]|nr:ATP-dependent sacrificial sulfur transferase LarE [Candidatus Eisenbacteria bacterium]
MHRQPNGLAGAAAGVAAGAAAEARPAASLPSGLDDRYQRLRAWLEEAGSVVVAFSGGTDSALVLKVAHDVLGEKAIGVTASSPSLPKSELEEARSLAREIGARHEVIESHEMDDPRYRENTSARCYFCKGDLYGRLVPYAEQRGYAWIVDGTNLDDTGDHRPGRQAASEHGVRSPLLEAGLTKQDVRDLSRALGLRTWDKPAAACLSSRIPHGIAVQPELLARIEQAESFVRSFGIRQLRVRHHGAVARIEIDPADFPILLEHRALVAEKLKSLGYRFVSLDIEGFRSGSLNR